MIAQPVIGVILNAEYKVKNNEAGSLDTTAEYYMKQTSKLDNACGVIACLHTIYNN